MNDYRRVIMAKNPHFNRLTLGMDGYSAALRPWLSWSPHTRSIRIGCETTTE